MKVPPEITYRGVEKTEDIESLVNKSIAKLERYCDHISSCRVAIEKMHDHPSKGSPFRVRLDITVPPGHELAVNKSPNESIQYKPLVRVIRDAFEAARRQLIELNKKQKGQVKKHPDQEMAAIITRLLPKEGYGFLKTVDSNQTIYFHRNSVLHNDFDRLEVGTGVRYTATLGEKGLQATTVKIVDKPGKRMVKA